MKLNHAVGAKAEDVALAYLQKQGLRLVERNWHCAMGEVDLIMLEGKTYVFVEVKHRSNGQFGGVMHSITPSKCAKLTRTIAHYLQIMKIQAPCRVDAVFSQGQDAPIWLKNIIG